MLGKEQPWLVEEEIHMNAVSVQNPPWDSFQRADGLRNVWKNCFMLEDCGDAWGVTCVCPDSLNRNLLTLLTGEQVVFTRSLLSYIINRIQFLF